MEIKPKVILITGPAGSGKSATAEFIAQNKGLVRISEDDLWVDLKKDRPSGEFRTPAEEKLIQPKALELITKNIEQGKNIVFEFILFHIPPSPLIFYKSELEKRNINVVVIVLKPSVEVILERQMIRGRTRNIDIKIAKKNALHQLNCINSDFIEPEWIIDNSKGSLDQIFTKVLIPLD